MYIRALAPQAILSIITADVMPNIITQLSRWSPADIMTFIELYKERISTLKQLAQILVEVHNGPRRHLRNRIEQLGLQCKQHHILSNL